MLQARKGWLAFQSTFWIDLQVTTRYVYFCRLANFLGSGEKKKQESGSLTASRYEARPPPSQEIQYEPADFTTCFLLQHYEFNVQSTIVEPDYTDFFLQIYFF